MTEVVWKYSLPKAANDVEMPSGAVVLTVAEQHNEICLWAKVDPAAGRVTRTFQVVGTGHAELDGTETYLGSAQLNNGNFVFHVFERVGGGS
jgi:hypothetical protein